MEVLYALFFGAGAAAFAYSRMGRRVGYGNSQNVAIVVGVVFVLSTIVFFTIMKLLIPQE